MMFGMQDVITALSASSRLVPGGQRARRPASMASLVVEEIAHRILAP
jgi:hypothetical protein